MQHILDYAAAKTGFVERHPTPHAELVLGSAPGMPEALGWVFRCEAYFTIATGEPHQVIKEFGRIPLRALDADVLGRFPVGDSWTVIDLVMRTHENSPLQRIVAVGPNGEASILFEGANGEIDDALLASLRRSTTGRTLRDVVAAIPATGKSQHAGD